jgi:hypothetical protein
MTEQPADPFRSAFKGRFENVLRWGQLDALWKALRNDADGGWYIYAVGEPPPQQSVDAVLLENFLMEIDRLLRREHAEDYCGVVFTDSMQNPGFVKIFDPHNLGVSCGFSDHPPLPGWILSKLPPVDLKVTATLTGNRRRWWQRFLGEAKTSL